MAPRGRIVFVGRCWMVPAIVALLLPRGSLSSPWYDRPKDVSGFEPEYFIQSQESSWWQTAESGCGNAGGKLLSLQTKFLPPEVFAKLRAGVYWMGGFEYNDWRWTDGSRLYTYKGYRTTPNYYDHIIQGNSALQCHLHCGPRTHWFGLSGTLCYCLIPSPTLEGTGNEDRCPGNWNERCGDAEGMSVYKTIPLEQPPSEDYECGFIKFRWGEYEYHLSDDCTDGKCAICNNTVIHSPQCSQSAKLCYYDNLKAPWDAWNSNCHLAKLTETPIREGSLFNMCYRTGYWIGLKKHTQRRWIDGRDADILNEKVDETSFPRCLALQVSGRSAITPLWTKCSYTHKAICETMPNPGATTKKHVVYPPSTTVHVPHTTSHTPGGSRATTSSRPKVTTSGSSSESPSLGVQAFAGASSQSGGNKTGAYVGISLGIVAAVVIAIVAALLMYRRQLMCFQSKHQSTSIDPPIFQNPEYAQTVKHYDIPVATVKPIYQNVDDDLDDFKKNMSSYYNTKMLFEDSGKSELCGEYDPEAHYEVPVTGETDLKEDFSDCGHNSPVGMTRMAPRASRIIPVAAEPKPEHTASKSAKASGNIRRGDTYAKPNKRGGNSETPPTDDADTAATHDELYEAIAQPAASYDRIFKQVRAQEQPDDGYDKANHKGINIMTSLSSDYSQACDFTNDDDDLYHVLDERFIEESRHWTEEEEEGGKRDSGSEGGYFNIGFTPDVPARGASRRGKDDIYSLAQDASNA